MLLESKCLKLGGLQTSHIPGFISVLKVFVVHAIVNGIRLLVFYETNRI